MKSLWSMCWIASAFLAAVTFDAQVRAEEDTESSYLQGMALLEADSPEAAAAQFDAAIAADKKDVPSWVGPARREFSC